MSNSATLFAGTANPQLALAVARAIGVAPGGCRIERFPDGEVSVRLDQPVRGHEVFIVQPTSPPVNEHLLELLAFVDAAAVLRRLRSQRLYPTSDMPAPTKGTADESQSRRAWLPCCFRL
jgi:phosphoribosylpyrophosphate synthetase